MIKTIIVAGGNFPTNIYLETIFQKVNYIIAADRGFDYLKSLNIRPNFLIGDFDSLDSNLEKIRDVEIIKYPIEKSMTDLDIAIEKSILLSSNEVLILGGSGTRLDHTIINIFLLKKLFDKGIIGKIIDDNNEIILGKGIFDINKSSHKYLSVIPLYGNTKLSISGVKFPLENKIVNPFDSLTISNEIIEDSSKVEVSDYSIIIKSQD